ncbi:hypothetical protein HMN09_00574300 [Mycena chlorophos]|uniref:Uncharacterized protein n=1 Tax=Mycena chlorophos TaxID=658473 RepID=A0A8H6TB17_MYCCL|nr:hypothetical protein HMN09_00574300 [Mycena chlorophos]
MHASNDASISRYGRNWATASGCNIEWSRLRGFLTPHKCMNTFLMRRNSVFLRSNIHAMQTALENAKTQSADPPSLYQRPVVMRKVPNGKGTGRHRLEIDEQFLGSTYNTLRGSTGLGEALGCSSRTVRRRALDAGLATPGQPVQQRVLDEDGVPTTRWQSSACILRN